MSLALRLNPDGMQLWEIKGILEAELLWEPVDLQLEIEMAQAADLMSDVLTQSIGGELLLTGLANSHVIRTAEMVDIKAIVFVHDKRPDEKTVALAKLKGVPLLTTRLFLFEVCARLAMRGLTGSSGTIW